MSSASERSSFAPTSHRKEQFKYQSNFGTAGSRRKQFLDRQYLARSAIINRLRQSLVNENLGNKLQAIETNLLEIETQEEEHKDVTHPLDESSAHDENLEIENEEVDFEQQTRMRRLNRDKGIRDFVLSYFVTADTLCEIPNDLSSYWLCYMRPEGIRGIVFASNGVASLRLKNGHLHSRFPCDLPRGITILEVILVYDNMLPDDSRALLAHAAELDCNVENELTGLESNFDETMQEQLMMNDADIEAIEHEAQRKGMRNIKQRRKKKKTPNKNTIVYICATDVLYWNNCSMATATAECRLWFLQHRYLDFQDKIEKKTIKNMYPIGIPTIYEATNENIETLYNSHYNLRSDCICFVHKDALYIAGFNPLYLTWRDKSICRWCIDTVTENGKLTVPNQPIAILEYYDEDETLRTADGVVLYKFCEYYENDDEFNNRKKCETDKDILGRIKSELSQIPDVGLINRRIMGFKDAEDDNQQPSLLVKVSFADLCVDTVRIRTPTLLDWDYKKKFKKNVFDLNDEMTKSATDVQQNNNSPSSNQTRTYGRNSHPFSRILDQCHQRQYDRPSVSIHNILNSVSGEATPSLQS